MKNLKNHNRIKMIYFTLTTGLVWFMYNKFIIVSSAIFYLAITITVFICLVFFLIKKIKLEFYPVVTMFYGTLVTLFLFYFTALIVLSKNTKLEFVKVDIVGYYTSRVDGILFKFNGKSVGRPLSGITEKVDKEGVNFYKNYYAKLSVKKCLFDCYYIEALQIVNK